MQHANETILWSAANGIRCVLVPYDDSRYQLKLMRDGGTVRADLFSSYTSALAASREWQQRYVVVGERET